MTGRDTESGGEPTEPVVVAAGLVGALLAVLVPLPFQPPMSTKTTRISTAMPAIQPHIAPPLDVSSRSTGSRNRGSVGGSV